MKNQGPILRFATIGKCPEDEDLKGKSTSGNNSYPGNLTVTNHYEYIVLPTLVYELEYPRSDTINWYYVAEKVIAVFGVLVSNYFGQA